MIRLAEQQSSRLPDPHQGAGGRWMEGRTAIVTGGGLGGLAGSVGYAISRVLGRHGARVAVMDREPAAAEVTVSEVRQAGGEALEGGGPYRGGDQRSPQPPDAAEAVSA